MGKPLRVVLFCVVLAVALWAAFNLEWVEEAAPSPLGGEAATNPLYATEKLLYQLGAKVHRHLQWDQPLPPVGSTLVLLSGEWAAQSGGPHRLRHWVEQGGHLVVNRRVSPIGFFDWVSVSNPVHGASPGPCQRIEKKEAHMTTVVPNKSQFELCDPVSDVLKALDPSSIDWTVSASRGDLIARIHLGAGTVTAHGIPTLFDNRRLAKADHAHLAALILQAGPGHEIWFIEDGEPAGFWTWLWHRAWVAVVLGLCALALGLWRGARRWGPLMGEAQPVRRSMAEQIHGTAQFLANHGRQALYQSAQRALDEAARQRLYCFDQLTVKDRAKAIAEHTGLPPSALAQAMLPPGPGRRAATGQSLQLLEVARRRLRGHSPPNIPTSEGNSHADPH